MTGPLCAMSDCEFPAALWTARVIPPAGAMHAQFIARPLGSTLQQGVPLCVDHCHQGLDYMLASSVPVPTDAEKPERMA